jgi:hypothetical protein
MGGKLYLVLTPPVQMVGHVAPLYDSISVLVRNTSALLNIKQGWLDNNYIDCNASSLLDVRQKRLMRRVS